MSKYKKQSHAVCKCDYHIVVDEGASADATPLPNVQFEGEGTFTENTTHNANCQGVSVSGGTSANYTNNFSSSGNQARAKSCRGCTGNECVTSTGTITSTFAANPTVFLPSPPIRVNSL
ncbi:MAG: hypothetical protein K2X48_18135 [Chitinophagaceae bacterium]|nr:hypothetical protein [Chitinophagaceae bacterium]